MKVLLLTPHYPPEIRSASRLMAELAEDLAMKHEVTVVTPAPPVKRRAGGGDRGLSGAPRQEVRHGVRVTRVVTPPFINVAPWLRAVTHFTFAGALALGGLHCGRHDVIVAYSPPLTVGLACDLLARLWGAPFVLNVQDIYPQALIDLGLARDPLVVNVLRWIEQYSYRRASALTVHSPGNRELLVDRGVPDGKLHTVFNWVDTEAIRPGPRRNALRDRLGLQDEFVVLFAGVLGYAQDMEVILDAADRLRAHANLIFVVAGEGVRKAQAVEQVRARGLSNVRLLPLQPLDAYPLLVGMADVCLVTLQKSVTTPVVPSKIMTIMAAGRPIIAAVDGQGDAREIIARSGCGVWTPPGDAVRLADAILTLYRDADLCRRLSDAGRVFAEEHFNRRAATAVYLRLLDDLSRARAESRPLRDRPSSD